MPRPFLLAIIVILLLTVQPATAQDCIDYGDYLHLIRTVTIPGTEGFSDINDMVARGNTIYIGSRPDGLVIARVTDDAEVEFLSITDTLDEPQALAVHGRIACVADGESGLLVFDVRHLEAPLLLAKVDALDFVHDVEIHGHRAFFLDSGEKLIVADIKNPSSPQVSATIELPFYARSMARQGNLLYLSSQEGSMLLVDISHPDRPVIQGEVQFSEGLIDFELRGNLLVLVYRDGLVELQDFRNPNQPELLGSIDIGFYGRNILLHDDLAVVGNQSGGFTVLDINDRTSPILLSRHQSASISFDAIVLVDNILVAGGSVLDLVDFSTPEGPPLLGSVPFSEGSTHLIIHGDYAYCGKDGKVLTTVDLSNPFAPAITAADSFFTGRPCAAKGNYLYVADTSYWDLDIYSLENPAEPEYIKSIEDVALWPHNALVRDNLLFIFHNFGFSIYDVTDPANPDFQSYKKVSGCKSGDVQGQYLYLGGGYRENLMVWDISNPTDPHLVAVTDEADAPHATTVHGNYLFVSNSRKPQALQVFDISIPAGIHLVAELPFSGAYNPIHIKGDFAYFCPSGGLVHVINIEDPTRPFIIGAQGLAPRFNDIALYDDYLIALDARHGIYVTATQCPISLPAASVSSPMAVESFSSWPNPFNPQTTFHWTVKRSERLEVAVYDVAGRRLVTLADREFTAGPCSMSWNGCSQSVGGSGFTCWR